MWTISSSLENQQLWTNCSQTFSNTFYYDQQEISQSATPSTSSAETSPTKVITMRSAYRTSTQQTYYTKRAWQTARQHQHQEQRSATQTLNSHSIQRNTKQPTGSRQTTVDDLHQTRHQLRNEGASKILNRANYGRSTEAEASTEVHHAEERSTTSCTSDRRSKHPTSLQI